MVLLLEFLMKITSLKELYGEKKKSISNVFLLD